MKSAQYKLVLDIWRQEDGGWKMQVSAVKPGDYNLNEALAHATAQLMVYVARTCDLNFNEALDKLYREAESILIATGKETIN